MYMAGYYLHLTKININMHSASESAPLCTAVKVLYVNDHRSYDTT